MATGHLVRNLHPVGRRWRISVRPASLAPGLVLPKVFLPFFTTKPTGEGTGLGLSLAHDIVVQGHGGRLEVRNREEGGAEFVLRVPG